jgi:hypothetical protein
MKRKGQDDRPIVPPGKLTAVAVRNATKPGLYGDGLGLYLQVSAFGTGSWIFRFMLDGRARKMGLGAVHTVSLAEAREDAIAARSKVRKGIDPIEAQKEERAHKKLEAAKANDVPAMRRRLYRCPSPELGKTRSTLPNGSRPSTRRSGASASTPL